MQTCYNCGKQVPDEVLICPDCGALVRRYTDTPPRADVPPNPEQIPIAPVRESKELRFRGSLKAWLVFLIVATAYLSFNFLLCAYMGLHIEEFEAVFAELPSELIGNMQDFVQLIKELCPILIVMDILLVGKLICHIWLLRARRRSAFFVSIIVSLAALVVLGLMGGTSVAILYFFDPLFTWLGLRRLWPFMEK